MKKPALKVMAFDCFIFDFDGTLACSQPAYSAAFHHSVRLHTGLELADEHFSGYWNLSPQDVLSRYGAGSLDAMMASFEEHYYANHHHHLSAYDGIVELLKLINNTGGAVAVVSLKPRRAGELELDMIKLRPYIHLSVWGDDVPRPKPEPDGVLFALNRLNIRPGRTLVIGDSPTDIRMGQRAGTRTAAALWSGSGAQPILAELPDFSFDSTRDLLKFISNSA